MAEDLFTLRAAVPDDMQLLNAYAAAEGMDQLPGPDGITVAQDANGSPVGFIRLQLGKNGIWHVNPVVVYELWRAYGVGQALMEDALANKGELRLVARGSACGFYERLGYQVCEWDEVDMELTEGCDGCPYLDDCNPRPFRSS
ncbi:MAG: GNAT family N-acetyltransferase [Eggerthellaceae bacterium]|nr:GNAT family N-acetyltransferase [Eggerthellaceae bacterium]